MIRSTAGLLALLALLVLPAGAEAATVDDLLDRAASCLRRGKPECALEAADLAIAAGPEDAREALRQRATALALLDRPEEAREAFRALLEVDPSWRPQPDVDPRIREAAEGARRARLLAALPERLDPGPPPRPPASPLAELLPPPALYAPKRLVELDPEAGRVPVWRLGLGGGIAFVTHEVDRRFDPGPSAVLEVSRDLSPALSVWAEASLTLLGLDERVVPEPGFGRGLSTVSLAVGLQGRVDLGHAFALVFAGGLGPGGFGVRGAGDVVGVAGHALLGLRYALDPRLGLRLDLAPSGVWTSETGLGGHLAAVLRAEVRF